MSRIVRAKPFGVTTKAAAAAADSTPGKEYLNRIAKYIPGEIIAGYLTIIAGLSGSEAKIKLWAGLASGVICWVFTPIYFRLVSGSQDQPSLRTQQIVSFIAFPIWAYATSGKEGPLGSIYEGGVASAIMILFSIISGAIVPTEPPPPAKSTSGSKPIAAPNAATKP